MPDPAVILFEPMVEIGAIPMLDLAAEHSAELIGEVAPYEERYRLCYIRGPESIIVALATQLR